MSIDSRNWTKFHILFAESIEFAGVFSPAEIASTIQKRFRWFLGDLARDYQSYCRIPGRELYLNYAHVLAQHFLPNDRVKCFANSCRRN